jgi:hypothetical protein
MLIKSLVLQARNSGILNSGIQKAYITRFLLMSEWFSSALGRVSRQQATAVSASAHYVNA